MLETIYFLKELWSLGMSLRTCGVVMMTAPSTLVELRY